MGAYAYHADDPVLLGIVISRTTRVDGQERWTPTRYFVPATVLANDRDAGRLVIKMDDTGRIDWCVYEDDGPTIVVPAEDRYPLSAADAWEMVDKGTHPDLLCEVCKTRTAEWLATPAGFDHEVSYCAECSSEVSGELYPIGA